MNTTYNNKQELVNTVCRVYTDFLGFDLNRIECNERYFNTVQHYAGKINALIDEISDNANNGKCYLIFDDKSTYIMPVDVDKRDEHTEQMFKFVLNRSKHNLCYLIDYDTNMAKQINGADIFAELADKLTA